MQTLARLKDIAPEITELKAIQIAAVFKELWKANGDNISRCVTGTAGVKSSVTFVRGRADVIAYHVAKLCVGYTRDHQTQTTTQTIIIYASNGVVEDPATGNGR